MTRIGGGTILSFYLLVAFVHGIDEGGGLVPNSEDFPNPSGCPNESLISNEILWDLSSEGESSSLSDIVPPKVNCTEEGIFPVSGSCHDYYYCQDLASSELEEWYVLWFTCPEGKVFDEDSQMCLPHSFASNRPECQQGKQELTHEKADLINDVLGHEDFSHQDAGAGPHFSGELPVSHDPSYRDQDDDGFSGVIPNAGRKKRSVKTVMMVDIVAQSAKETCRDVKSIDNYVKQISSKRPLSYSTNRQDSYKTIIKHYNDNIRTAQQNANRWKGENGILAAIEETYLLTEEFEPKFREFFLRMNTRVAAILESERRDIEDLGNEINDTKVTVKGMQEILEKTINKNVNKFILQKLNTTLAQKKEDHRRLVKEYNESLKETEFQELTEILEYIKNNSLEIQEKVEDTRRKIESFHRDTHTDYGHFNRTRKSAGNEMQYIRSKKEWNNREIYRINANRARLRGKISREQYKISQLTRQIEASNDDHRREVARLKSKARSARLKQQTGRELLISVPFFGWIAGPILMHQGAFEESAALYQIMAALHDQSRKVQYHRRLLKWFNAQIESADRAMDGLETKTRSLQREIPHLTKLDNNLQSLKSNVELLLTFLAEAIASLERMKEVFVETEDDLDKVLRDAGRAHTVAQKRIISHFMYYVIDDKIKKNWENAREKIISIRDCVSVK